MKKVFNLMTDSDLYQKEEEFFNKTFAMSYSGLNKLLFSPRVFYNHYVLGQREDVFDKGMVEGKLIHCLFLKPEDFDKEFLLMPTDIPSDSNKAVLHALYLNFKELNEAGDPRSSLLDFSILILDILKSLNLYQSLVDDKKGGLTGDQKRLEKIINEKNESYWEYLKKSVGKSIIDHDVYEFAKEVVEKLQNSEVVMHTMGYKKENFTDDIEKINEKELISFNDDYLFGLRGFIDNLVFDHTNKVIRINDLKKSSKDLLSFVDSIEYYRYWMQASIYCMLVRSNFISSPQFEDYSIEFRFIVIDPFMQIAPIKISDATLDSWTLKTINYLKQANYHFENKDFNLPYDFLINKELVI